jgi:hypothetical protein
MAGGAPSKLNPAAASHFLRFGGIGISGEWRCVGSMNQRFEWCEDVLNCHTYPAEGQCVYSDIRNGIPLLKEKAMSP